MRIPSIHPGDRLYDTRLTMIARLYQSGSMKLRCRCDCGVITSVFWCNVRRGKTKSCGCLRRERNGA